MPSQNKKIVLSIMGLRLRTIRAAPQHMANHPILQGRAASPDRQIVSRSVGQGHAFGILYKSYGAAEVLLVHQSIGGQRDQGRRTIYVCEVFVEGRRGHTSDG